MSKSTLQVKQVPVTSLIPDPRNARIHSPEQLIEIATAIQEFGWTNPILIDEKSNIIAGHGRCEAAKLKLVGRGRRAQWVVMTAEEIANLKVPAITLTGLTPEQIKALRISDNKIAENSTWDENLLKEILGELDDSGLDLDAIGFSSEELDSLLGDLTASSAGPTSAGNSAGNGRSTAPQVGALKFKVIVECESEQHQGQLIEALEAQGLSCQPLMS